MSSTSKVILFSDGACSGNPGPGGWGTVLVSPEGWVQELGGRDPLTTNNRMELISVLEGLKVSAQWDAPVEVYTDSTYVIRGITQWVFGWRRRGWITAEGKPVANADLWRFLSEAVGRRKVEWKYVRGHSGIPGNERVDQIAVDFSQGRLPALFRGQILQYDVDLNAIPQDTSLPDLKPLGTESKAKPFSYLSLVGNAPMRHSDWPSCQARVKGVSGAKFKKAMSAEEEKTVLNSWGFSPKDLSK